MRANILRSATSIALILAALATPMQARAQEAPVRLANSDGRFHEVVLDAPEISGAIVLGLVALGPMAAPQPMLRVGFPPGWMGNPVCVRAISADGLYESANTFDTAADAPAIGAIPYLTAHSGRLATLGPDGLAVHVTPGRCDTAPDGTAPIAPAFWNSDPSAGKLNLLVNSLRASQVFVYVGDDPAAAPVACLPAQGRVRHSYDMVCPIARGQVAGKVTTLRIFNLRDQMFDPEIRVTVDGTALQ